MVHSQGGKGAKSHAVGKAKQVFRILGINRMSQRHKLAGVFHGFRRTTRWRRVEHLSLSCDRQCHGFPLESEYFDVLVTGDGWHQAAVEIERQGESEQRSHGGGWKKVYHVHR